MHTSGLIRRSRWSMPLVAVAAAAALSVSACGSSGSSSASAPSGSSANAGALTNVSVRTDVIYSGADLPLMVGIEQGFYREHGLNITMNPGTGSVTTLQTVANGSDDIGLADAGALVQAVGKGMPVEMVAGIVQQSPDAIFTRSTSGITSAGQLAGKTGGYAIGSAPETLFPAYAAATGLNPDSVTFDKVNVPTRDNLFSTGKTQFTFGDTNVTTAIMQGTCGCKLNVLSYADAGLDMLSTGIVTSTSYAQGNAATIRAFLAATTQAVNYTEQHTAAAVADFHKVAGSNSTLSSSVVLQQWQATRSLMTTANTKGEPFGCTSTADWQSTIKLMEQHGGVAAGKVSPSNVATNEFLSGCATASGA